MNLSNYVRRSANEAEHVAAVSILAGGKVTVDRAWQLRSATEAAVESFDDATALQYPELYRAWKSGTNYTVDDRVQYGGTLYRCLTTHTSQASWTPDASPSLWAKVLIPDPEVIPEWEQPESTNPYMGGDKVSHNSKIWVSDMDGNIWEPGVYGWTEVKG